MLQRTYLVIDGYNVLNAWTDVFDLDGETLEENREKLINILSNYQGFKKMNVIVVFDAHMVKGGAERGEVVSNVSVVFTKEGETADSYIERLVYNLSGDSVVRVVTSDYMQQTTVLNSGGIRMSPRELKEEIWQAYRDMRKEFLGRKTVKSNTIASRLLPELFEKLERLRRGKD